MKQKRDFVAEAAQAHTDCTVLYGVIALLEGGTVSADIDRDVQRIISICKTTAGRCVRRYDRLRQAAARTPSN